MTTTLEEKQTRLQQLLIEQDWPKAQRELQSWLANNPHDLQAHVALINCFLNQTRIDAAQTALNTAIRYVGERPELHAPRQNIAHLREQAVATPYSQNYILKRSKHMDFPAAYAIEMTGRCNAACTFCPHSQLERNHQTMAQDLFEKIVEDLKDVPKDLPFRVFTSVVNEPFMDKSFESRLHHLAESLPQAKLEIISNFNVMPKWVWDSLWDVPNVDLIRVSFYAAEKEEYEQGMKIDFERTVENLKRFMAENRKRGWLKSPLRFTRVTGFTEHDKVYPEACAALFNEFEAGKDFDAHVVMRSSWLGALGHETTPVPFTQPCMNWLQMNIHCDGTVAHCCMDSKAEYAVGNVAEQHVLDVYNGPAFRHYRENLSSRESAHPCNQCSLM